MPGPGAGISVCRRSLPHQGKAGARSRAARQFASMIAFQARWSSRIVSPTRRNPIALSRNGSLRIPVLRSFTSNGNTIEGTGVCPDHTVDPVRTLLTVPVQLEMEKAFPH
jgi:hypothetical protein